MYVLDRYRRRPAAGRMCGEAVALVIELGLDCQSAQGFLSAGTRVTCVSNGLHGQAWPGKGRARGGEGEGEGEVD